jgi:hypothetical protein
LTRLEDVPPSAIARPDPVWRSVNVTRAFALVRLWFATRPVTVSSAPGASAVFGGALTERSFIDGVAAVAVLADSATSAPHDVRHASDLARRSDNVLPLFDLSRLAAPAHRRQRAVVANLLTVGRSVKERSKDLQWRSGTQVSRGPHG